MVTIIDIAKFFDQQVSSSKLGWHGIADIQGEDVRYMKQLIIDAKYHLHKTFKNESEVKINMHAKIINVRIDIKHEYKSENFAYTKPTLFFTLYVVSMLGRYIVNDVPLDLFKNAGYVECDVKDFNDAEIKATNVLEALSVGDLVSLNALEESVNAYLNYLMNMDNLITQKCQDQTLE